MRLPLEEAETVTLGGIEALYLPHEMALLRSIRARADAGGYAKGEARDLLLFLHGAKAMLGATILADSDPWRTGPPPLEMTAEALSSAA